MKQWPAIIHSYRNRVRAYDMTGTPIFDAKGLEGLEYIKAWPTVPYYPGAEWMRTLPFIGIGTRQQRLF